MYTFNQILLPSLIGANTRFLAIAGYSLNGPVNTPFVLKDDVSPKSVLGDCRLAETVQMAMKQGVRPLILRLNGSHGECVIEHEALQKPILRFTSFEATDECNEIQVHLFPTHLVIEGLRKNFAYYYADYKDIHELSTAIKHDLYFSMGEVDVEVINQAPLDGICSAEYYVALEGADDGFNYVSQNDESDTEEKTQLQLELVKQHLVHEEDGLYEFDGELGAFLIDTLLFTDIPYEKAPQDLIQMLGSFAYTKTKEQDLFCSVVLGSDQITGDRLDEEGEDSYSEQLKTLLDNAPYSIEETRHPEHVEVVIGMQDSIDATKDYMSCATAYACMRYLMALEVSATNKSIELINTTFNQELLKDEVAQLESSGYICIVPSIRKGFVPSSSKNIYPHNTLFSKPNNLRSVHYDVSRIKHFFDPYIGTTFSFTLLQSITNNIQRFIDDLLKEHPIYQDIILEILDFSATSFRVSLVFKLYGEIETVRTTLNYEPTNEVTVEW